MDVVLDEVINLMDAEADNVWGTCGTKRRMVGNPLENYGGTKRNADWMMTLRLADFWAPHLLILDVFGGVQIGTLVNDWFMLTL